MGVSENIYIAVCRKITYSGARERFCQILNLTDKWRPSIRKFTWHRRDHICCQQWPPLCWVVHADEAPLPSSSKLERTPESKEIIISGTYEKEKKMFQSNFIFYNHLCYIFTSGSKLRSWQLLQTTQSLGEQCFSRLHTLLLMSGLHPMVLPLWLIFALKIFFKWWIVIPALLVCRDWWLYQ